MRSVTIGSASSGVDRLVCHWNVISALVPAACLVAGEGVAAGFVGKGVATAAVVGDGLGAAGLVGAGEGAAGLVGAGVATAGDAAAFGATVAVGVAAGAQPARDTANSKATPGNEKIRDLHNAVVSSFCD